MRLLISDMLWLAGIIAVDEVFSDEPPYSDLSVDAGIDAGIDAGWDTTWSTPIGGSPDMDHSSSPLENLDSQDDDAQNIFLDVDQTSSDSLGNNCSSEPDGTSKRRKQRSAECKVDDRALEVPPDFHDLSIDLQQQLYRSLVCPSPPPGEALIPVCSSRLSQNNHFEELYGNPGFWAYTLMDSFLCTSCLSHLCSDRESDRF